MQVERVVPSQVPPQSESSLEHFVRCPAGVPVTALHVPSLPFTLQASHWPLHEVLQQKPSTQSPFKH
jgi:hypothetical protein